MNAQELQDKNRKNQLLECGKGIVARTEGIMYNNGQSASVEDAEKRMKI